MKGSLFVAIALLTAAPSFAQDAPAEAQAQAQAQAPSADARVQQVRMMEGVLSAAVRNGAETLARQLQVAEPGSLIITGTARARGFALEGYGVFFDVDVPQMKQSVAWSTMMLVREAQKQRLRQLIAATADSDTKHQLQVQLRQLEAPPFAVAPAPGPVPQPAAASGTVAAQTVTDAPPAAADPMDPNQLYTDAVKTALIDAMLNYSAPMNLGPGEWLTIAARDSDGPLMPGAVDDASTILLRVKGSDIIAFQSKQISLPEARKRVLVKEF